MEEVSQSAELKNDAANRLAVALDFPSAGLALDFVDRLDGSCQWMKVGLELYYAAGNRLIEELVGRGLKVFLDLKLHDIPNTVAGAVRSVSELGASLLTVHALGGEAMLRTAAEATAMANGPRLLAVTILTSMDARQMGGVGLSDAPGEQVLRLARLAESCGVDGFVCSSEETEFLRRQLGAEPFLIVPGIRPAGSAPGDQRRVATPREAMLRGASMLVVGRPITQAGDPAEAVRKILDEIESAGLNDRLS